ncbi:MAG TPA: hypothetical protein VLC46_07160 [Thermoanaerobaculia bacterium]|jgi:hypothetical protein|nr:hypothetical protein [Thermoanaerobaculia bacterium]
MNGEIIPAILFGWPVIVEGNDVAPQRITHLQSLSGRHARFLLRPALTLRRSDRFPVTPSERDDVLSSHRVRIANPLVCRSREMGEFS